VSERLDAIRVLGRGPTDRDKDLERLGDLLHPEVPNALQEAALAALQRNSAPRVAEVVLAGWTGYGPASRTEVLNLLFSRPEWLRALLTTIEGEKISIAGIGAVHQQKLVTHSDSGIRERAVKLFAATRADRQSVLKDYRSVEKLTGDPAKGAALFRQNCSVCHRFKGEGHEIGVDLSTLAGKPVEVLLVAILDPNQAVEARYVNYTAMTKDDREISGVITAETPSSITLRSPGGNEEVLLRSELKALTSSGLSLMPEGFEKAFKPQDLADLISYILAR
jgi:putative heme-binding domain-containing protein